MRDDYDSDRNQDGGVLRQNHSGNLIKPSVMRKRKGSMPPLLASYPGSSKIVTVKLKGHHLYDSSFGTPAKKKLGSPKGSKNRPGKEGATPTAKEKRACTTARSQAVSGESYHTNEG